MSKIILKNVDKEFHKVSILENINLEIQSGRIYGIIGANGCGKTVLLKLICGLSKPTNGKVFYMGKEIGKDLKVLPDTGVIINKPEFFDELNAFQNLKLLAQLKRIITDDEIKKAIQIVGLQDDNKKVSKYSLGMKQRLGIAQAMMENPNNLILDEITNGLDDDGIAMVRRLLKEEVKKDKIIVITSHNKEDIELLCDHVYKIQGGKLTHEK